MCDLQTLDRIEQVVEQKMAAGHMFTAFDVTLYLQSKGLHALHREIRKDIKRVAEDLMWRFGYEQTLVSFRGTRARAFVYHPYGTDARLHKHSTRTRAPAVGNPTQIGLLRLVQADSRNLWQNLIASCYKIRCGAGRRSRYFAR
jgi:hypothetical protein